MSRVCELDFQCALPLIFFFFQAEDGIRDIGVTGVQTCALPIWQSGAIFVTTDIDYAKAYVKTNNGGLYAVTLDNRKIFDPENDEHLEQLQQGYLNLVGEDYDDEEGAMSDYNHFVGQGDLMMDWAVAPDAFDAVKTLGFQGMRMRERPGKITGRQGEGFDVSGPPIESVALFDKKVPSKRIAGWREAHSEKWIYHSSYGVFSMKGREGPHTALVEKAMGKNMATGQNYDEVERGYADIDPLEKTVTLETFQLPEPGEDDRWIHKSVVDLYKNKFPGYAVLIPEESSKTASAHGGTWPPCDGSGDTECN